jgi:hypothetical protein
MIISPAFSHFCDIVQHFSAAISRIVCSPGARTGRSASFNYLSPNLCHRNLVGLGRVELPTRGLGNRCSIHLSYRPVHFYCNTSRGPGAAYFINAACGAEP